VILKNGKEKEETYEKAKVWSIIQSTQGCGGSAINVR
jgi:hypothetical protein